MRTTIDIGPGIVTDDTTFASSPAWVDCDKVRFWRGRGQVIGGWERFLIDPLMGLCRNILPWSDNSRILNVAFGMHNGLQVSYGGVPYDITPTTFVQGDINGSGGAGYGTGYYGYSTYGQPSAIDTFPLTWSLANYGESLMANPRGQTIFWWENNTATPAAPLTNAPEQVTYMLVTYTRQVMAFGCNEEVSGDFNPMCIRFSDIEDPEDWTTALDNNAGEVILEGGSRIVAARVIGSYLYVWTDFALFLGNFTGDSSQPWTFEKVGEHCGLIGPNAAVVNDQVAYWMGPDVQFRQCALGGAPSVIVSPVQVEVKDNLPIIQVDKIVASTCVEFGEVRFDYPDARDDTGRDNVEIFLAGLDDAELTGEDGDFLLGGAMKQEAGSECSRYVAFSVIDGAWSRGTMARTAYVDSLPQQYPLATDPNGVVYIHERGNSADGANISWFIESADLYLGDAADPMLMIKEFWPDFQDQISPVQLTMYVKKYPQGNYYQHGPYSLPVGRYKRGFRASGRLAKFRFSADTTPTGVRFGKFVFELEPTGLQ